MASTLPLRTADAGVSAADVEPMLALDDGDLGNRLLAAAPPLMMR